MSHDVVNVPPTSDAEGGETGRPGSAARRMQSRVSFVDTDLLAASDMSDVEEVTIHEPRPDSASDKVEDIAPTTTTTTNASSSSTLSSSRGQRRASRPRRASSTRKRGSSSASPPLPLQAAAAARRGRGSGTTGPRGSPQRRPTRRSTSTTTTTVATGAQRTASPPLLNTSRTSSPPPQRRPTRRRSGSPNDTRPATQEKDNRRNTNSPTPGSAGSAPRRASAMRGAHGKPKPGITATCLAAIDFSILRQNLKPKVKRQRLMNEFVTAYQRGLELFDKEREAELGELFAQFKEASFLPQRHELLRFARYITALREDYSRELAVAQAVARAAMDGATRCLKSVHRSGEELCLHTALLDPRADYKLTENCARDEAHYGTGRPMPEVRSRGPAGEEVTMVNTTSVLHHAHDKEAKKESQAQAATIAACFTAPLELPNADILSRLSLLPPLAELVERHREHDALVNGDMMNTQQTTSFVSLSPPSLAITVPSSTAQPQATTNTPATRSEKGGMGMDEQLIAPLADDQAYLVQERAKTWQARMARVEDVVHGFDEVKTALDTLLARMRAQDAHQRRLIERQKRALDEAATRVKLADDVLTGSHAQADESVCFAIARLRELSAELRGRMDELEANVRQTLRELGKDSATICIENGVLASEATVAYRREACVQACRSKLERSAIEQAAVMRAVQDFVVELWRGTARTGREEKATLCRRALPAAYEAVLREDCDRDTLLRLIEHLCVQSDAALKLTLGALDEQTHFLHAHPTEAVAVRRREATQRAVVALLEKLDAEYLFAVDATSPSGVPLSLAEKIMELVRNYEALLHNARPASAASTIDVDGAAQPDSAVSPRRGFFDPDYAVPAEARATCDTAAAEQHNIHNNNNEDTLQEKSEEQEKRKRSSSGSKTGSMSEQPAPRLAFNPALLTLPCVVTTATTRRMASSGTSHNVRHQPRAPTTPQPGLAFSLSTPLPAVSARNEKAPLTTMARGSDSASNQQVVSTASCPSPTQVRAYLRRGNPSLQSPTQGEVSIVGVGRWDGFAPHIKDEAAGLLSAEADTLHSGRRSTRNTVTTSSHGGSALTRAMARQEAAHSAGPAPSLPLRKHLIAHVQREYQHDRDAIVAGTVDPTPAEATKKAYHNEDYYYIDRQRELYRILFA